MCHSQKNSGRYYHKCMYVFMYSTCYSHQILMELDILQQIKKKTQIPNFMKICSVGTELFHADMWTNRQDSQNAASS